MAHVISPLTQIPVDRELAHYRMLTEGITHEKKPNRDGGSAKVRKRMGTPHTVGGAGGEHAGR
jgi:hypothetical protein